MRRGAGSKRPRTLLARATLGAIGIWLGLAGFAATTHAQSLTPTQDDRRLDTLGVLINDSAVPAPPFSAFSDQIGAFESFPDPGVETFASQTSELLAQSITGDGWASTSPIFFPGATLTAESVLDVTFTVDVHWVYTLAGTLTQAGDGQVALQLERLSPSPAVLVSSAVEGSSDVLGPLVPGSYRLLASGQLLASATGGVATFDIDLSLVCSSALADDGDSDGIVDGCDGCPLDYDPGQEDTDGDGIGDACNDAVDADGDDWADLLDNCPAIANTDQFDADYDGRGDVCDDPEVIRQILSQADGTLYNPGEVAFGAFGRIYVAGRSSNNVWEIDPSGLSRVIFRGAEHGSHVQGIAADADGSVYVAGGAKNVAFKIDRVSRTVTQLIDATGDGQGAVLDFARSIAVADDGRVFVSGSDSENVFEIKPTGGITEIIDTTGLPPTSLDKPVGLDVDTAGNVYVLGSGSSLKPRGFRIAPDGAIMTLIHPFNVPSGMVSWDVAVGPDGVYFAGDGLVRVEPGGEVVTIVDPSHADHVGYIDVDELGIVYYAQSSRGGEVVRITPAGQRSVIMDASGDSNGNPLSTADGIAVAPGKRIAVVGRSSANAFLITNPPDPDAIPALDAAAWLGLAALMGAAGCRRLARARTRGRQ